MVIIGVCGASGSGKSTLAEELGREIGEQCTIIRHDCYYRNFSTLSFAQRCELNYDEPVIFDHDLFLTDIQTLLDGKPITRKAYNYALHLREDTQDLIYPTDVLIVEGIHTFYDPRLCALMFLRLYMQVDPDICLLRRIARDMNERGRSLDSVSSQYIATVKPMFDQHIRNYIEHADVIVARGGKNARIVSIIASYIRETLHANKTI